MEFAKKTDIRHLELMALGEMFAAQDGVMAALKVSRNGGTKVDFLKLIAANAKSDSFEATSNRLLGLTANDDFETYSISRLIRAADQRDISRAGMEKSLSDLVTTKTGLVPNGTWVPFGVLARDFNMGTASQAGNLVGSSVEGDYAPDPLRKVSVLGRMGATFLTGCRETPTLPRFTSSTSAAYGSEVASATAVSEESSVVALTGKRIAVTMVLSRQAMVQAKPALDRAISRHLTKALFEQLENGAINGAGTGDDPLGIRSTTGVGNVAGGTDGATITWTHLDSLENLPATANVVETENSGFIVNSSSRSWMRRTQRASGLPFIWVDNGAPLLGHRALVSNALPSNLVKGSSGAVCSSLVYSADWSELFIAIYGGGVDLLIDRITLADVGKIRITAALIAGVGVNVPAAFAKMDDAKTA